MNKQDNTTISKGSGNVFADLDFPDAEEMQAKAMLVSRILDIINKRGWTQKQAAEKLALTQPKISSLKRGQFRGFSLEKLMKILNKLNQSVEIVVHPRPRARTEGHITVTYAAV